MEKRLQTKKGGGYRNRVNNVKLSSVRSKLRFEAVGRLLWDGLRNLEQWSDEEDDNYGNTPYPNFHSTPTGRCLTINKLNVHQARMQGGCSKESGLEFETLPQGHHDPAMKKTCN
ncbi:hypothetical protein AVEN_159011-1 [Araneus ventricosus]|uniref:Uncharacterized protein n=1 Tax=Araneus ventricosus TaxID=182803 RepID=A0A4Y2BBT7_ARAVE|nr:hypothetical protein AVEN_159011-1 [Araneus ventricosus]